jgi:hypothetical protein
LRPSFDASQSFQIEDPATGKRVNTDQPAPNSGFLDALPEDPTREGELRTADAAVVRSIRQA